MKAGKVKDLMVPLAEYATVGQDATLYEAVAALEKAQKQFSANIYQHRAVLVLDKSGKVTGKIGQIDILRGLEPKYQEIGDETAGVRYGFSRQFLKNMMESYGMWQKPLDNICRKASEIRVGDIMHSPGSGEFVNDEAPLDEAIHQLVMGGHQSLLVTNKAQDVVGILRLTDVFSQICEIIKMCDI